MRYKQHKMVNVGCTSDTDIGPVRYDYVQCRICGKRPWEVEREDIEWEGDSEKVYRKLLRDVKGEEMALLDRIKSLVRNPKRS